MLSREEMAVEIVLWLLALESSPWARAFLDAFVFGDAVLRK